MHLSSGSLIDLLYQAMGITSSLPVIASNLGGICQLDEVGSLGVQSLVHSSGSGHFPPLSSSFSPHFASSGPSSLPYSRLSFPALCPPFFSAPLVSPLAPSSSALPQTLASLPHPFATFAHLFPSLSSHVRFLNPSASTFAPSVSSLALPVVTVTTSFPSSSLASSSCSLVFSSASPVVSSGSLRSSSHSHTVLSSSSCCFFSVYFSPSFGSSSLFCFSSVCSFSFYTPLPHFGALKVPQSSPSASFAAASSRSAGSHVSLDSHPGTWGTSGSSHEDVLHYVDDDVRSNKDDSNSPVLGKVDFSRRFQEMINLITGYFPHAKPSMSAHSDDLILWLDTLGNSRQ